MCPARVQGAEYTCRGSPASPFREGARSMTARFGLGAVSQNAFATRQFRSDQTGACCCSGFAGLFGTQRWNAAATSANTASMQAGDVSLAWKPTSNHWAGAVVYFATGGRCAALVRLGSPSTRIIDAQHADSTSAKLVENAHRQSCWQPQHRTTITLTFTTSRQLPPRAALARRTAMR